VPPPGASVKKHTRGRNNIDVGRVHHSLGVVRDDLGMNDEAAICYDKALRIRRAHLASSSPRGSSNSNQSSASSVAAAVTPEERKLGDTLL